MGERVVRELAEAFPSPDPGSHRYAIENDKYSFYLYDERASSIGEWERAPVAKFSYLEMERLWQVSWMPPQGRWQKYGRYFDIESAIAIIKADPAGCFMGEVSPLSYLKRKGST